MLSLRVLTLCGLLSVAAGQSDGNPHNWDRRRRCDHTDYTPRCGICEGYGGVPTGDDNDKITLTTCVPVTNQSAGLVPPPVKPVWGTSFTVKNYHEILIGPKTDPFCFNSFPSNSSAGPLCYRPDSGTQVYDFRPGVGSNALREDLEVKTAVGNVTSTVIHQGQNFWVINKLPWYAAGVHQCICVKVHEGSDKSTPVMYPIQYNWTQQMFWIGRETIGVEYSTPTGALKPETLDHWAFGPHHVWGVPGTGEIRRMWQPYNGLQIFPTGNLNTTVDPSIFAELPPPQCRKKGGAIFRIKCDDDGFPVENATAATTVHAAMMKAKSGSTNHLSDAAPLTSEEQRRARAMPGAAYRGDSFGEMSAVLNGWLERHTAVRGGGASVQPCESFTAEEIQKVQAMLYLARDVSLDSVYNQSGDNRRLRGSIDDLRAKWAALNADVAAAVVSGSHDAVHSSTGLDMVSAQRDGHCHEAVMWWVHHVSEDMKRILAASGVVLPLLSTVPHGAACAAAQENGSELAHRVCSLYQEQVTCASCHSNVLPPGHAFLRQ